MCGFAGSINWTEPEPGIVQEMTALLSHRGPDAGNIWAGGPAVLGHRRLAVIDTNHAADQPMADSTGSFHIVFNGEIYNFRELREGLVAKGRQLKTRGDTEVLLAMYMEYGQDCLKYLNGMFAFAIWDSRKNELFIARDRMGEKPLYYFELPNNGIVFASELKALRLHPAIGNEIDMPAVSQFLSMNYILGDRCIIQGVKKLAPGHSLFCTERKRPVVREYWNLAASFENKREFPDINVAASEFNELFDHSVKLRLESDVPLGGFLSSGIDSGAVVKSMCLARPVGDNKTFSIGFREAGYSETTGARTLAEYIGTDHFDILADWDIASELPKIIWHADEPFADNSIIPFYFLARFARRNVTVCLSGDGGDELLGGYETYIADKLHHYLGRLPGTLNRFFRSVALNTIPATHNKVGLDYKLKRFFNGLPLEQAEAHYSWRGIFDDRERAMLLRDEALNEMKNNSGLETFLQHADAVRDCHYLDQSMYVDMKTWLVDDVLHKVDRATMAHSLESRAPFLDHRLVEFAASLPVSYKINGFKKKYLLQKSQCGRLPAGTIKGKKKGFNSPMAYWLQGEIHDISMAMTHSPRLLAFMNEKYIDRLWSDHISLKADNSFKLYGLVCLGMWLEQGNSSQF